MIQNKGVINLLILKHWWSFPAACALIQSLLLCSLNALEERNSSSTAFNGGDLLKEPELHPSSPGENLAI